MSFFFFNDTATTEIYTLSLHDALPISERSDLSMRGDRGGGGARVGSAAGARSEEHTSELQSHLNLVCRLLLEKKKDHADVSQCLGADPVGASGASTMPEAVEGPPIETR